MDKKGKQTPKSAYLNASRARESSLRRDEFVIKFGELLNVKDTCEAIGITRTTYDRWRKNYPDFVARIETHKMGVARGDTTPTWEDGFAAMRLAYFGMESTWFHLLMIDAYETTRPGNITMILLPPEHGKTTLYEDFVTYDLARHPDHRHTVGSESQTLARKILGRVKTRLDPRGPFPNFVKDFGPFMPQAGGEEIRQPWGQDYFSVWRKSQADERDYSMVALGIGSQIAGSRTDHLHVDDVTSLRNVNQTETILETFRQDWLSRPGERGRTTINGTRVAEDDFYSRIEDEIGPDILRIIRFPAIHRNKETGQPEPLWPYDPETKSGYTMEMLDRLRAKVGEDAWARNYMQKPRSGKIVSFDRDKIMRCANPLRIIDHGPPAGTVGVVTLDPGFGRNVVCLQAHEENKIHLVDFKVSDALGSNEDIMAVVREAILDSLAVGVPVTELVIETMAFQKGLQFDDSTLALEEDFGLTVVPHLTGNNKYDANMGIPAMARSFRLREVDLPYGDDASQYEVDEFVRELEAWKPYKKGNRLVQDRIMAFWFGWILWRERRWQGAGASSGEQFQAEGTPWTPTGSGILVPTTMR